MAWFFYGFNMAVALSTIRTLVRSYLDETTAGDWTNVELLGLINQRYHRVYTAVVSVFEDYNITKANFNTVAAQQEYSTSDSSPIPSNIFKIRRIEINYDVPNTNSVAQRALPLSTLDEVRTRLADTNIGLRVNRYTNYYYLGGKIGFIPIPDKAGTNAVTIWYIKTLADLASDSDTIDLPYPERYWHLIAEGATSDALRFGQQDSGEADKFDQKFIAGILLMQQELEDRVADETKGVIDTSGEMLDFGNQ